MEITVHVERCEGPGASWLVTATDGEREWSDTCWTREEADELAADIEQGLCDPWDED